MKTKVNKKGLFIFFIMISIIVIIIKISSSFIFYKKAFNDNVYDDLLSTRYSSQSVWISIDEVLNGENVTAEKLSTIKLSFDETLYNLQTLNSKAFRDSSDAGVNLTNYTNLSFNLANMRGKYLKETQTFTLTEEEINTLIEAKEIFKTLEEIIYENLDGVERNSWGVPNVLRDDLWLNIINTIQLEHDKLINNLN